ncbi:hypothetical protein RS84_00047 [Microbacterium hydrocarbonoxydans]|uniref:Uncharacterized protein n=1 Tax=Microbacterium hydrocarbonoxydans TaxID=273678 RepID=A0A0M2HYP8_9MICO|nr:hypothetical protein [Microbacterium hydrocarbonoxydans]KJL49573.1 hypothetical protein RS84_00047 [Microbacterium hydrocarbonoxydans]
MQSFDNRSRPARRLRRALLRGLLLVVIAGAYLALVFFVLSLLPPSFVPGVLAAMILAPFAVVMYLNSRRGGWPR